MRISRLVPIIIVVYTGTLGARVARAAGAADDWTWKDKLAPGATVEIRNVNGELRIEDSKDAEVQVLAHKSAHQSNPAEVRIEAVKHAGGITICPIYPVAAGEAPNQCIPGGGRMNVPHGNDVSVAFTIKMPAGLRLVGHTVNGGIKSNATNGEADVKTVNGSIEVAAVGTVKAQTVNGSVHARMDRTDWKGELHIATVNGSVTIDLPAAASAEVHASTVNGGIQTDFGLPVEGKWGPKRLTGTIGSGGRTLTVNTVNGSIKLLRHSS
jgi:hypothetical protein